MDGHRPRWMARTTSASSRSDTQQASAPPQQQHPPPHHHALHTAAPSSYSSSSSSSSHRREVSSISNYTLGDCLGRGAFGSVYRALNWSTGQTVAVKRIQLSNIPKSELGEIMSEIDLLKNLRHPNIVKYKGSEKTRNHLFVVLEYCENGSLQDICKRFGKFPEGLVSVYINQVLEGLAYLHDQGVIHRDIKGANILTTKDGSVKLADFGVATRTGAMSDAAVVGSPYWMAPEVIDQSGATTVSDIWSVGCVVIELLQGQPPYHFLDPMPALFRIVQDDCPPLPSAASVIVKDFLHRCFQKDANLRPSAKRLLRHPWMVAAKRQLEQKRSVGSIGRAGHAEAVKSVKEWNAAGEREGNDSTTSSIRPVSQPQTLRRISGHIGDANGNNSLPRSDTRRRHLSGPSPSKSSIGSIKNAFDSTRTVLLDSKVKNARPPHTHSASTSSIDFHTMSTLKPSQLKHRSFSPTPKSLDVFSDASPDENTNTIRVIEQPRRHQQQSSIPRPHDDYSDLLTSDEDEQQLIQRIRRLREVDALGAKVFLPADLS